MGRNSNPKYHVARMLLGMTTVAGVIAVVGGAIILAGVYAAGSGLVPLAVGIGLVVNGFLAVAGAQMGAAALDTAIATRETADAVAALVAQNAAPQVEPRIVTGLRATR